MSRQLEISDTWWDTHWPSSRLDQHRDLWNLDLHLARHAEDFRSTAQSIPQEWLLIRVQHAQPGPLTEMSLRSNDWVALDVPSSADTLSILSRLRLLDTKILPARYLIRRDPKGSGDRYYAMIPHPAQHALIKTCPHCHLISELGLGKQPLTDEALKFSSTLCPFHWRWILTGRCLSDAQCARLNEIAAALKHFGSLWSQAHDERVRRWVEKRYPQLHRPQEHADAVRKTVRELGIRGLVERNRSTANSIQQRARNSLLAALVMESVPDGVTTQVEFEDAFPLGATLLDTPGNGAWHALALSIEEQIPKAQEAGINVINALSKVYGELSRDGNFLSTSNTQLVEQMILVMRRYLGRFGVRRRLGLVEPSDDSDRQILSASIPLQSRDYAHDPVLWIYCNDRVAGEHANPRYSGIGAAISSAGFAVYSGNFSGEAAPPDCAHPDHSEGTVPDVQEPAANDKAHPPAANQPSSGSAGGDTTAHSMAAPANHDEGNDKAAAALVASCPRGAASAKPTQVRGHGPPRNAPTGPATTACWNCGGRGHLSSQCSSPFVCHNCGKMGHIVRGCPAAHSICSRCGGRAHLERFCRIVLSSRDDGNGSGRPSRRDGLGGKSGPVGAGVGA